MHRFKRQFANQYLQNTLDIKLNRSRFNGERKKMGVLAIHRATHQALARLPSDLNPLITSFIGGTRLDWRTCKEKEAYVIYEYTERRRLFVQELMERRRRREIPLNYSIYVYRPWYSYLLRLELFVDLCVRLWMFIKGRL